MRTGPPQTVSILVLLFTLILSASCVLMPDPPVDYASDWVLKTSTSAGVATDSGIYYYYGPGGKSRRDYSQHDSTGWQNFTVFEFFNSTGSVSYTVTTPRRGSEVCWKTVVPEVRQCQSPTFAGVQWQDSHRLNLFRMECYINRQELHPPSNISIEMDFIFDNLALQELTVIYESNVFSTTVEFFTNYRTGQGSANLSIYQLPQSCANT